MIRTTNVTNSLLLLDPFSIDAVEYSDTDDTVRMYVQGTPFIMLAKVFEADVLPAIEEGTKYGTLND